MENSNIQSVQSVEADAQRSPSGITPTVHNIISVADLGTKVNLKALSEKAINIKYNPRRFPAATFQLQVPKATVLVFSTGKILCTGANTEDNSKLASRKVAKTIHKLGEDVAHKASFHNWRIENVVATASLGFHVQLDRMRRTKPMYCEYEPEAYPGLIFKHRGKNVTFIIFSSGKVTMTGGKSRQILSEAFEDLYPLVKQFAASQPTVSS